ncbi:MAG: OmpA family protein [Flavobacteriales bacterium]|nr:OmpA family protein [Flavobacteriales bacterium]
MRNKIDIIWVVFIVVLFAMQHSFAQSDKIDFEGEKERVIRKKAGHVVRQGNLLIALEFYKKLIELNPEKASYQFKIANLYRITNDYVQAEAAYAKLNGKFLDKHPEVLFYLGVMQKQNGNHAEAKKTLKAFIKVASSAKDASLKKLGKTELLGCDYAIANAIEEFEFEVKKMPEEINNPHIDFSPIPISEGELVFGSLRESEKKIYNAIEQDSLVLPTRKFYSAVKEGEVWKFNGEWDGPFNSVDLDVANGAFSVDKTKFYFSQCKQDSRGKMICALYSTNRVGRGWGVPKRFNDLVNLPGYTTSHPTVTLDSKTGREVIYFVSDRPGGKGGMDLWYTEYNSKKKDYKEPKNAGRLNTGGTEATPYYDQDSRTLYFSSNGYKNIGGLDVFKTVGEKRKWDDVQNLGGSINSVADDLGFVLNEDDKGGFLTSNRKGGQSLYNETCCDDIYEFEVLRYMDRLLVGNMKPIPKEVDTLDNGIGLIVVFLKDEKSDERHFIKVVPVIGNEFTLRLKPNKEYVLQAKKMGCFNASYQLSTINMEESDTLRKDFLIQIISRDPIEVQNIYYEFGSDMLSEESKKILDTTVLAILQDNPDLIIEISSHTDSKGSVISNLELSQKRAQSVVDYMLEQGIDGNRLGATGLGESKPIAPNTNPDGSDNPLGRKKNRRTEFAVVDRLGEEQQWK